jgi:hypothetical protein
MGNGPSPASFGGQDADAQNFNIKNVRDLVYDQVVANGNSGAAATINWTNGAVQKITLTANCTFTFTAPIGVCKLALQLTQDGTGSRTATWPAAVKWSGAAAPTLSTAAGATDWVTFIYDGTNYWGTFSPNFA